MIIMIQSRQRIDCHQNMILSKEWVQQFVQSVMQNPDGIEVVLE